MSNSSRSSDNSVVIGQDALKRRLLLSEKNGRVPHGLLFHGPDGIGKTTMARFFAKALLCGGDEKPCGVCPSCKKFDAGSHPDIFSPETAASAKSIGVEAVRDFISALSRRPMEGGRKIALLTDDLPLTEAAQNALLKTLEEPPGDTVFIIEAVSASELLPTIVSRCTPVRVPPLTTDETERLLIARGVSPEKAKEAALRSDGIPGRAIALAGADDDAETVSALIALMKDGTGRVPASVPLKNVIAVWRTCAEDMLLMIKAPGRARYYAGYTDEFRQIAEKYGPAGLIRTARALDEAEAMLAANVSEAALADKITIDITESK